jgi:undecaprenyl-diphosphatase
LCAFICGYLSIASLLRFLRSRSTLVFIVYRIVLGGALLVLLAYGYLHP